MSQFKGTVSGNRQTEASRQGSKNSGLITECNGWDAGIRVEARHVKGHDIFDVYATGGSHGGKSRHIATLTDPPEGEATIEINARITKDDTLHKI